MPSETLLSRRALISAGAGILMVGAASTASCRQSIAPAASDSGPGVGLMPSFRTPGDLRNSPIQTASQVYLQTRDRSGDGYAGVFEYLAGDHRASVASDPEQGVWIAPGSDPQGERGAWRRVFNDGVDLKWFGATGDDDSDDSHAVQAAVRLGLDLNVTAGTYRVKDVSLGTRRQTLKAVDLPKGSLVNTNAAVFRPVGRGDTMFVVRRDNVGALGVNFIGTAAADDQIALREDLPRDAGPASDLSVQDCSFATLGTAIESWGWGTQIMRCVIGSTEVGVDLNFPATSVGRDGPGSALGVRNGFRGFMMSDIKAHGVTHLVRNIGPQAQYLQPVMVTDITSDIGTCLWTGVLCGVISNTTIANTRVPALNLSSGSHDYVVSDFVWLSTYEDSGIGFQRDRRASNMVRMAGEQSRGRIANGAMAKSRGALVQLTDPGHKDIDFWNVSFSDGRTDASAGDAAVIELVAGTARIGFKGCAYEETSGNAPAPFLFGGAGAAGLTVIIDDISKIRLSRGQQLAAPGVTVLRTGT